MLTEIEKQNLLERMDKALKEFEETVSDARTDFDEKRSAYSVSLHFEDIAVYVNQITQMVGLLGYVEMLEEGETPLQGENA